MAKKYGLFRFLTAKHFLSKTLEEIDSHERKNKFDLPSLVRLLIFQNALEEMFPENSSKQTLGMKFKRKVK